MQLFTSSRRRAWNACQKLHYLRYVQGYCVAVEKGARRFGSLFHQCIEKYWLAPQGSGRAAALAVILTITDVDPYDLAKLSAMVFAYCTRWDTRRVGYIDTVLGVERKYRLPMINPETGHPSRTFERAGKVDVLVLLCDGRKAVIEHKTSSESAEPGSTYRSRLLLDPQVSEYFDAMNVAVVIYDVAVKPGQEPLKATVEKKYTQPKSRVCAECKKKNAAPAPHTIVDDDGVERTCENGRIITDPGGRLYANMRENDETPGEYEIRCLETINEKPEFYLQDLEVVRLEGERREYLLDVWNIALQARVSERTGVAPRNPDACFRYGSPCDFWDVCTGTASLDDPTRFKRIVDVNPELTEEERANESV